MSVKLVKDDSVHNTKLVQMYRKCRANISTLEYNKTHNSEFHVTDHQVTG